MTNPYGNWIRAAKRAAIYERDSWECVYCGQGPKHYRNKAASPVVLTLDHVIAREAKGSNDASNLVTACLSCNSSRQNKPVEAYATSGAMARIIYLLSQPIDMELGKAIIESLKHGEEW